MGGGPARTPLILAVHPAVRLNTVRMIRMTKAIQARLSGHRLGAGSPPTSVHMSPPKPEKWAKVIPGSQIQAGLTQLLMPHIPCVRSVNPIRTTSNGPPAGCLSQPHQLEESVRFRVVCHERRDEYHGSATVRDDDGRSLRGGRHVLASNH